MAGRYLQGGERSEEFIKQLERAWIRNFGPMQTLQVDEHRAWSSDAMREWCTEHGIQLQISPGQSHTRLAILERRHQVTRRALTLFLNANPGIAAEPDGLITALNYVIPQINRMPNVCGYSPVQWTLGYTPHIPGLLMDEMTAYNPAYLDPSSRLMEKLRLQQEAAKATAEADTDRRLRRALLRKYMGQHVMLNTGDLCCYWRDAPTGSSAKLQWRGPATIIMREPGPGGPTSDIYWIGHGTSLLRAAPEHVKPAHPPADDAAQALDPLQAARQALDNVRSRGVTNYTDLGRTNKRRREEIDTDEEDTHDDRDYAHLPHAELPPDTWQTSEDGRVWTRVHNIPRRRLFVPTFAEDVPVHLFSLTRVTDVRRGGPHPDHVRITDDWKLPHADRELHYVWTGTTTFVVENERSPPWSDDPPPSSDADDEADDERGPTTHTETETTPGPQGTSSRATTSAAAPRTSSSPSPPDPFGLRYQPRIGDGARASSRTVRSIATGDRSNARPDGALHYPGSVRELSRTQSSRGEAGDLPLPKVLWPRTGNPKGTDDTIFPPTTWRRREGGIFGADRRVPYGTDWGPTTRMDM